MPAVAIRTPYDGLAAKASDDSAVSFEVIKDSKGVVLNPGVLSKTVQSEKDSTDINLILKAAEKNGGLILSPSGNPIFGDFSNIPNWMEVKNTIAQAERSFALLPADVRQRFDNNPGKLVEFLSDPANDAEAVKLRLKPAPPAKPGPEVVLTDDEKAAEARNAAKAAQNA